MISKNAIIDEYGNVAEIAPKLFRFTEEIGNRIDWYYLRNVDRAKSLLIHSEGVGDDEVARAVISESEKALKRRAKLPLKFPFRAASPFGFEAIIAVPPNFHGIFEGTLDDLRDDVVLCVPIHEAEFSGNESEAEFRQIHFRINVFDWRRIPQPKCSIKFDNPKTGGGTTGDEFVLSDLSHCLQEIQELSGVRGGYIVVRNYLDQVCEIRAKKRNLFSVGLPNGAIEETTKGAADYVGRFLEKK